MNTHIDARDQGRPAPVVHAETGADEWRSALLAQRTATLDHRDFYALAGELVETLRVFDGLAGVLAGQVAAYGGGRAVYDDEGANPTHRLRSAVLALAEARHHLAAAERAVNRFWSQIGHIGVHVEHAGPEQSAGDGR